MIDSIKISQRDILKELDEKIKMNPYERESKIE
jgi:hypothetical protein